jgi:hypothetical protein
MAGSVLISKYYSANALLFTWKVTEKVLKYWRQEPMI